MELIFHDWRHIPLCLLRAFDSNLDDSFHLILKHLIGLLNILQTIPVSNQRRGVNQSLLYKRENLGTVTAVHTLMSNTAKNTLLSIS